MPLRRALVLALAILGCARSGPSGGSGSAVKVGPPRGAVVVVGGGALGPEIYRKFIELAGGPDAYIVAIPTAGGGAQYGAMTGTRAQFELAGAKNVKVLHTYDRAVAESDTFVAHIKRAGGVWFDGGRQFQLADAYGGTKSEAAFHDVLARGGVVGGSSAGASILGSYMVRGAPSNDNGIMAHPVYGDKGFGFLRNTGIDQHVVARERQPDIADSLLPKFPGMLFISEDEGTAWVVQGDDAEIIGRSKAFAYNGKANDPGRPFLTLWPGDRYNLAERVVTRRAIEGTGLTQAFVDSLFGASVGPSMATVLVAQDGKVLVNSAYNVPSPRRYMPATTIPNFDLGDISAALNGVIAQDTAPYGQAIQRRVRGPSGMPKTTVDTAARTFRSNVDELYRTELAIFSRAEGPVPGWQLDTHRNQSRQAAYVLKDGRRGAFVRYPARQVTIIILSDSDTVHASAIADRIAERLLP